MSQLTMRYYLVALLLPLLSACGLISHKVSHSTDLMLLPPSSAPQFGIQQQKVTVIREGKKQQFLVFSEFTKSIVKVAVLVPTGQRLLTMQYDGSEFTVQNDTNTVFPAKDIMAVMQFAVWQQDAIMKNYLERAGWLVSISAEQRELRQQQQDVLVVQIQDGQIEIQHLLHQYQVIIEPLEASSGSEK
ncbi:DUF3261 domain-containing protein [Methylophaga sp. OBS3]|uniref:DUF3261 domain-containing protein n=1 Tax=Methylophaga sp. OBS3 TaxID=2991934 RepID=UPI00225385E3|nr:DUF3261 domain-containing protein [Methylophaga sp. OBS3]MCX4189074.1 DUF3261 domain-containing protein [Methylophaga sp. OBS3]